MRVLFLTHNFPRHPGDVAGSFLLRLALALAEAGVEVRVLAPAAAGLAARDTIETITVERFRYAPSTWERLAYTGNMAADVARSWSARLAMGGMLLGGARALRRAIREWQPDVVHAHWWFPSGLAASLPGALVGRPLVVTSHGSDVRLARSIRPAKPLLERVARTAAAYTFVSSWLRDEAAALAPCLTQNSLVAPMPVVTSLFRPPADSAARSGALFVGRLNEQKGVADLLAAAARQRHASPLIIVGDGPDGAELRARAAQLGVAARVRWVPNVTQAELATMYASAELLVVPSREEGLGLVAAEALLCETPVVAYASGGVTDIVRDGRTGLLAPAGDVAALAAAIDRLVGHPTLARRLGETGRSDTAARFDPRSVAETYRGIYERVVAATR